MAVFHAGFEAGMPPVRVRFEAGGRHDLSGELDAVGGTRALVLTTPGRAALGEEIAASLGPACAGVFAGAAMHTPVDVTERALAAVAETGTETSADCLVAVGGGSTIGLGKAIALRLDLPQIVLPTTYAGSEATPVLGQTENGVKTTLRSGKVQPEAILYDAELIRELPVPVSVTSGLNAMAHAVEGLYARDANRLSTELALAGLRAFVQGLPVVVATPGDLSMREDTLYGAWACGTVLATAGMALHHKLCHALGGMLNLPHAETHAILLPHTAAFNEGAVPKALAPLASLLQSESVGGGLFDFATNLGAPTALRDLGVVEADLGRVSEAAIATPYWNPRPLDRPGIRALLQDAYEGNRPKSSPGPGDTR